MSQKENMWLQLDTYSPLNQTSSRAFLFVLLYVFAQNNKGMDYLYRIIQRPIIEKNNTGTFYFYRIAQGQIICTE